MIMQSKARAAFASFSAFVGVALATLPAVAQETKAGDLVITQPWSRATPNGAKVAAGYLQITNKGTAEDHFIAVSTERAASGEIHEMAMNNGVMTMRPLDKGLAIAPGQTVTLAPGGYHLMFMQPKVPFKEGDKIPVTLSFEKAGKVDVTFDVRGIAAGAGGMSHDSHTGMGKAKHAH